MPDITEFPIPTVPINDAAGFEQTVTDNSVTNITNEVNTFNTNVTGGNYASAGALIAGAGDIDDVISHFSGSNLPVILDADIDVPSPKTFPANTQLKPGGGRFVKSGTGELVFAGNPFAKYPAEQIFSGFADEDISFTGEVPRPIYGEWFDTKTNFDTNCLPAFEVLRHIAPFNAGLHVECLPGKLYTFADTWEIDYKIELSGPAQFGPAYGATDGFKFPVNTTGIILHADGTVTGSSVGGRTAFGSVIRGMFVRGNNGTETITHTHVVSVLGLTVTRTSGATFIADNGFIDGNTINIEDVVYVIDEVVGSNTLTLKTKAISAFATNGSPTLTNSVPTSIWDTTGGWNGQDIIIGGVTYEILTCALVGGTTQTITLTTNFAGTSGTVHGYVQGINSTAGLDARPNLYHGIDNRVNAKIEGNYIYLFPGNGINNTELGPGLSGNTPNQNNASIVRNMCYGNYGNGIFSRGTNANQMTIANNDLTNNQAYGYWDHSFLGNLYLGNHTSYNYQGSAHVSSLVNVSVFLCEYSEAGQPPSNYGTKSLLLGGNPGAGFLSGGEGIPIGGLGNLATFRGLQVERTIEGLITKAFGVGLANSSAGNVMLGFGAAEEDANIVASGTTSNFEYPAYQLGYNDWQAGAYGLHHKTDALSTFPTPPIAFTGSEHALAGGQLLLPKGFYGGNSGTRRQWQYVDAEPTSGTVALGDIFWNNGADCDEIIGWIVTTAGAIGSTAALIPFGPGGGGGGTSLVTDYLTSHLSLTSSATLADTSINVTLPVGVYSLELYGLIDVQAGGFKCDFDGGTCVIGEFRVGYLSTKLDTTAVTSTGDGVSSRATDFGIAASTLVHQISASGFVDVTTAGTFIWRAAQLSSDASTTLVIKGTKLIMTPM